MIVLALAFHALENILEIVSEIESRPATESSLEKLRACSPMVIEDRKASSSSLLCFKYLLSQADVLW